MDDIFISSVTERYQDVQEKITRTAQRVGRSPNSIKIVVVTKTHSIQTVQKVIRSGIRILGENYAEEGLEKMAALSGQNAVEWHMIGHVQSRKANLVAENFNMLHSLDRYKIAARLDRILGQINKTLPCLLEFNMSGEESKFGWPAADETKWSDLLPGIEQVLKFPQLEICGLMTMPPLSDNPEDSRPYFRRLRCLRDFLTKHYQHIDLSELSMGTSLDYLVAVEEGATFVRVGQAVIGPRPRH